MKKMIVFVWALVMVCCTMSMAKVVPSDDRLMVMRRGDVFRVMYKGLATEAVQVTIYDDKGAEVFSEKVKSEDGFIRPYNLSQLPRGDYKICVEDESGEHTEKICTRLKNWAVHIAKLERDQEKYMVSIPGGETQNVTINIFDPQNHLVYSAQEMANSGLAQVFVLKDLDKGTTIQVLNQLTGQEKVYVTD